MPQCIPIMCRNAWYWRAVCPRCQDSVSLWQSPRPPDPLSCSHDSAADPEPVLTSAESYTVSPTQRGRASFSSLDLQLLAHNGCLINGCQVNSTQRVSNKWVPSKQMLELCVEIGMAPSQPSSGLMSLGRPVRMGGQPILPSCAHRIPRGLLAAGSSPSRWHWPLYFLKWFGVPAWPPTKHTIHQMPNGAF